MGLKEDLDKAEYIVVGIGGLFGYNWKKLGEDDRYNELCGEIGDRSDLQWLYPFLQKASMDAHPDERLKSAYESLARLTEGKNAYFITTTIDDYIYDSGLPKNRIVTPCGGFRNLQCEKHCSDELTKVPFALLQYVQKLYNKMITLDDISDKYPECPDCGANLIFNQVGCGDYVEAGYLTDWGIYQKWLELSMNRETLLLELGADLGFMSVIRSPFEKLAAYNRKAKLYRVHPTLYMGTPETEDRCISIRENPIDWINGSF